MWIASFPNTIVAEAVFSPVYVFGPFVIDQMAVIVWFYFGIFYSGLLVFMSVFVPVSYTHQNSHVILSEKEKSIQKIHREEQKTSNIKNNPEQKEQHWGYPVLYHDLLSLSLSLVPCLDAFMFIFLLY
jgi:hypothetical protein